jgi:hypothetical protein
LFVTILQKNWSNIGQTLIKKGPKIGQNFCSKFKTSGEDDDDDDDEEEDWCLLDQVATLSHLVKSNNIKL